MKNFDVIIIGGGMVGAILAITLSERNLKIALIDASPIDVAEDSRLIALNDGSVCLLQNIGVWAELKNDAAMIKQVHVSHRGHFGIARINAHDVNLTALGYVVPAGKINSALYAQLTTIKNIELFRPATLQTLTQTAEDVTVALEVKGEQVSFTAKKVIGADGSYSTVRNLLEIPIQTIDYQQSALVTVTECQRHHQNIAYERFLKNGAIAMLPLVGNRVATIWTAENEKIAALMQLSDSDFLKELQKAFGYRLGRLQHVGKRGFYPLKMLKAEKTGHGNVILLGNALHTIHPIAAQGLNLALYEIAELVENLDSISALQPLKVQHSFNQTLSHHLTSVFANDFFVVSVLRQTGMLGLDMCESVKKYFTRLALNRVGRVPSLLLRNET